MFGLAACGDDGTDAALFQRRSVEHAAELRATVTPVAEASDEADVDVTTETVAATGVVVPVLALDNSFRPELIEIDVGDEVLWENRGQNEHNVLRVEGEGWGVDVHDFQPGAAYTHVFTEPGEYHYYCSIHGSETVGMVGTVIVHG